MADDRPSTSQRVKGHTLRSEGKAHAADHPTNITMARRYGWEGFGLCSCGARSAPALGSDYARKQWHRRHKADVLSTQEDPT